MEFSDIGIPRMNANMVFENENDLKTVYDRLNELFGLMEQSICIKTENDEIDEIDEFVSCKKGLFSMPKGEVCKKSCIRCRLTNWFFHTMRSFRHGLGLCMNHWRRTVKKGGFWCPDCQDHVDEELADQMLEEQAVDDFWRDDEEPRGLDYE